MKPKLDSSYTLFLTLAHILANCFLYDTCMHQLLKLNVIIDRENAFVRINTWVLPVEPSIVLLLLLVLYVNNL